MKIFHISDLHIGLKLINYDLFDDQRYILDQIVAFVAEEQPDAILIAGDIYDKAVPSAEAVDLFDRFTTSLHKAAENCEIMMISGNHDSAPRVNLFRKVLSGNRIHMIGVPPMTEAEYIEKVTLTDEFGPVHFYLLPFVKPSMVKGIVGVSDNGSNYSYDESLHRLLAREQVNQEERNVLVSHQFYLPVGAEAEKVDRMDSEICTVGNIDQVSSDVLFPFDYAALGHIHKPMKVGSEFYRYCGTPIACSVSEAGQEKGMIVIEMKEKGNITTSVRPLKPLHQVRIERGELEDVLKRPSEDYVRVVLTDTKDLEVIDMQDRLRFAFPNLLEIRRETGKTEERMKKATHEAMLQPIELCKLFAPSLDEEDTAILSELINELRGAL